MSGFMREIPDSGSINSLYGYPAAANVIKFQNQDHEAHIIWHTDATPVTNFANAPDGSIYVHVAAATSSPKLWMKGGVPGEDNGTWTGAAGQGARRFIAKATQSGAAAPATASPIVNELGGTPVWADPGVGDYTLALTGAFPTGKTFVRVQSSNAAARICQVIYTDANTIAFKFFDAATPTAAESGDFDLEIAVFN